MLSWRKTSSLDNFSISLFCPTLSEDASRVLFRRLACLAKFIGAESSKLAKILIPIQASQDAYISPGSILPVIYTNVWLTYFISSNPYIAFQLSLLFIRKLSFRNKNRKKAPVFYREGFCYTGWAFPMWSLLEDYSSVAESHCEPPNIAYETWRVLAFS